MESTIQQSISFPCDPPQLSSFSIPKLIPQLSGYLWNAAELKMIEEGSTDIIACKTYNLHDGLDEWTYRIVRNSSMDRDVTYITSHRSGERFETYGRL